ncbi:MAG: dephospho-CoA kinase [Bacteroidales bacterium]|nr:dephospho-CoA kinase [Bacteroidales bacterium]
MEILVVTGGIGSGKSEVCRILHEEFGCGVYNADRRVKQLYDVHPTLLEDIESMTGVGMRDEDGRFVPSRLSALIFSDRKILEAVERLVFPALKDDFCKWKESYAADDFVVLESATIMEKPELDGFGDKIIVVDAPMSERMERASVRDGVTKESICARMQNQKMMNSISEGDIVPEVDYVIHNTGSLEDLRCSTLRAVAELFGK